MNLSLNPEIAAIDTYDRFPEWGTQANIVGVALILGVVAYSVREYHRQKAEEGQTEHNPPSVETKEIVGDEQCITLQAAKQVNTKRPRHLRSFSHSKNAA